MGRWLLLLLTATCLIVGPGGRCAMGAGPVVPEARHRSCCDPDPVRHGVPTSPCWSMACCVLFAPVTPGLALTPPTPCGHSASADIQTPDTHSLRPPTPPPRAAGIA